LFFIFNENFYRKTKKNVCFFKEKFDQWLVDIGTGSAVSKAKQESNVSPSPSSTQQETKSENQTTLPAISHEHVVRQPSLDKFTIPARKRPPTYVNHIRWNTSTHAVPNAYVPDLADAYPRDPFTKMPPRQDAIEVYRLLQSRHHCFLSIISNLYLFVLDMTLTDVKKFLGRRKEQLTDTNLSGKKQRPVVYEACHVNDIQTLRRPKKGEETYQPLRRFDESGLHFTDDARKSVFFQRLSEAMAGDENTTAANYLAAEEKAKWALFRQYGPELIEFLHDRHGNFKKRFDKVFIT